MVIRYLVSAVVGALFVLALVIAMEEEGGDQRLLVEEGRWGEWAVLTKQGHTGISVAYTDSTGAHTIDWIWFDATGKYTASGP